jgi:ketosteroid isomerase-like protein
MSDAIKAELKEMEDRRYKAMIAKDLAALDQLFGDGLVYTHSNAAVDSKASYIEAIKNLKFDYRKAERIGEQIQVYGDTAVITGQAKIDVVASGTPKQLNNRFINVWAKGPRGWQMVAWQSTPIPA